VIHIITLAQACVVQVAPAGRGCVEIAVCIQDVMNTICVVIKILWAHVVSPHGITDLLVIVSRNVNKSLSRLIYLLVKVITSRRVF